MKYDLSNIVNDKYKFGLTILRMHKKVNKGVLPFLIMKKIICQNILIYIIYIIISSLGFIILCSDFIPDYNKYKYLSSWLRVLTPLSFIEKLKLSHLSYIIICFIIFVICISRLLYMYYLIHKANHFHSTEINNIKINGFILILNHIEYIFFSYIIEFLSFIFYIEIIPNDFIIKKETKISEIIQKIFCVLNALFIIIYNINNYKFIFLINLSTDNNFYSIRIRIPSSKLYILILFQNFCLFHPIQCYLGEKANKIWCIIYNTLIILILIWTYFITVKLYNYYNIVNIILSFIGEFGFISIIVEYIFYFLSIKHENNRELLFFILIKLLINTCLFFSLDFIYKKIMIKKIKKRIFNSNPNNIPFDNNLINSVLFIREIIQEKNIKYINKIGEYLIKHKKQCLNFSCGCKIIQISNKTKNLGNIDFVDNYFNKINYYIESILIHNNSQNNYEMSLLLSEHFFLFKNNPVMSYSILQTLLHFSYKKLNKNQLIFTYEYMNKYIKYILKQKEQREHLEEYNRDKLNIKTTIKEIEINQYINVIIKIKKVIKYMIYYSTKFINIIIHKDNYENSTIAKINEVDNEIKVINSPYLNQKILSKLLKFVSKEILYTSDIKKYLNDLKEYNKFLSPEFLYKIFLFVDYFWNKKMPEELLNIFYVFTSNHNLYSTQINPEIYQILEVKLKELMISNKRKYYILFKYTDELKISFISESLIQKLNFNKDNLVHKGIYTLLIKDLIIPHNNAIKYHFIMNQNYIFKDKSNFIFDKQKYMIKTKMNSTFQLGVNKNILIISVLEINQKNKEINIFSDKNLNVISINHHFEEQLSLSLSLIKEFKIELKDLFGISIDFINKIYKKEIKKVKDLREYKILDTREYVLKNLFEQHKQINYYHISNKYKIDDDSDNEDIEMDEEKILKDKSKNSNKILKIIDSLLNNKIPNSYYIQPINYRIDKKNYLLNLKKIFEKINSYEQDKLESKNINIDYNIFSNYYNEILNKRNFYFNIYIEPKLIYDTIFYYCRVDKFVLEEILEINNYTPHESNELKNIIIEEDELNFSNNSIIKMHKGKKKKNKDNKENNSIIYKDEFLNENEMYYENAINNSVFFREKIKMNKPSRNKFYILLLFFVFSLLISCIIALNYQTGLIEKNDKIFAALYYNYYQRTQFIYINSIILSIYYELVNISNQNVLEDNKNVLKIIGNNLEESHQLFKSYYMDFKIELNEDFSALYEPLNTNKITVNWENQLFNNNYDFELALIVYRILDTVNNKFTDYDIFDCENLLLGKYLNIAREETPVYGNLIKLVYFLYQNYETKIRPYFLNIEQSFDESLNDFSKRTTAILIIIEILGILSFLSFFLINLFFLIISNKYIFQNILYMLMDFTQSKNYSFNNKENNISAKKKISNYILLLKEFSQRNLDSLKYNTDNKNIFNLKSLLEEDIHDDIINESKINSKRIKNKFKKNKLVLANMAMNDKKYLSNTSLFKFTSDKSIINSGSNKSLKNDSYKNLGNNTNNNTNNAYKKRKSNEDIHILNNKDLNNISNNTIFNNSKNDSTNILLNSSIVSNNDINNLNNIQENEIKKNKYSENNFIKITIDIILFQTKMAMLYSIKVIIIIFILFTLVFILFFVFKMIIALYFISNFKIIVDDFKTLTSQYNNMNRYWNNIKTLFILPNTTPSYDFNNTEIFFHNLNAKIYNIYNYRIKKYKRISDLYDILLSPELDQNLSTIEFCFQHKRCNEIKNSNKYLLSNGIESTVNLYAKEIANYYKIFLLSKNKIKTKEDIINIFINDRYKVLSSNINHIVIFLEEIFFNYFLQDEKDIVNNYYLITKILNIIEICYCLILNLFSIFFVYSFVMRIISSFEISSTRINNSILRMKIEGIVEN